MQAILELLIEMRQLVCESRSSPRSRLKQAMKKRAMNFGGGRRRRH